MGYIRGVIHGMIVGTAVGLAIAPQEGARTREQMRTAAGRVRQGVDSAQETARRVMPQVREAAGSATAIVDSLRDRVTGHGDGAGGELDVAGSPASARAPFKTSAPV